MDNAEINDEEFLKFVTELESNIRTVPYRNIVAEDLVEMEESEQEKVRLVVNEQFYELTFIEICKELAH